MVGTRQANSANRRWLALINTHPFRLGRGSFSTLPFSTPKNKEKHNE